LHERAKRELDRLGIHISSTHLPVQNLSGGQRQSIAVARAITFKPEVLILDEPTAALGVKEVNMVLSLIKEIKKQGVGIILITHSLQDVFNVCDLLMVLFEGKIIDNRPVDDFTLDSLVQSSMGQLKEGVQ